MALCLELKSDTLLDFFFLSLDTIKEVAAILGDHETELNSRSFYLHLNARCALILSQGTSITTTCSADRASLAHYILGRLDSLVDRGIIPPADASTSCQFPHMQALNKLWTSYGKDETLSRFLYTKSCINFGSLKEQRELLTGLKRCEDYFVPEFRDDYRLDEPPTWKRRSEPPYESFIAAQSLFQALEVAGRCLCPHTYAARFCIKTHRDSDLNEEYDFSLFLGTDKRWQDAHFHTVKKTHSTVSFAIEDGPRSSRRETSRTGRKEVKILCDSIKKIQQNFPTYRLKFLVENNILWKLQSEPSNTANIITHAITLQRFMAEESSKLTEKTKRILAVLLSYAVLHLHQTPWLNSSWGPANIIFLRTPSGTPLQPYIELKVLQFGNDILNNTSNPIADNNDDDDDEDFDPDDFMFHPYPSLVALAAMLIELHLARRLQTIAHAHNLEYNEDMNDCAKYIATAAVFDKCKDDISEQTREAIDKCLNPNIDIDDNRNQLDAHQLRSVIYKDIVSRLEYELEHTFSYIKIETLDTEAQKLDLTRWGQPIADKETIQDWHADHGLSVSRVRTPLNDQSRESQRSKDSTLKRANHANDFKFFDDQSVASDISSTSRDAYLAWKKTYRPVYDRLIEGDSVKVPVKIAVLDTGVDKSHRDYEAQEERIQRGESFIPGCRQKDDVSDRCGHGTHVAGLLLDYAPDAELYIAKICDLEPPKPATVAKAIDRAVNEWKVDVISMSFGFPSREVDGYELLEQSIKRASNQNVLLFAAASNNGANTKRAYPARHPDIICIHSTKANGAPSDFNPLPLLGDNFATIGEAVESAWPVGLCDRKRNVNCTASKSGTSFATPIASGIAAALLQYARAKLHPKEAQQLKQSQFMKAVLKAVSIRSQGYDYIAPSLHPDSPFGKGENSLNSRIRDAMKDV
ncbi:hypothetical protein TRIATDRAFT_319946 [Trichoderma atroviride IMI 206040]|uniref:Uncharacterized protein n=1 Tax=Hypocrea atroviridis (strain ATCC 20476 / IMI 206040) TaxID=452589 RepID=G9P1J0_HYPAI|nr:uncharacterized protein TRIATDRAFT_319946 [Trichoderma atroviride IMI 206040]EHK42543.1 hypothetical protein TRIATDRAFT_319946 [Trichoderma atroviride IMI 206040]